MTAVKFFAVYLSLTLLAAIASAGEVYKCDRQQLTEKKTSIGVKNAEEKKTFYMVDGKVVSVLEAIKALQATK